MAERRRTSATREVPSRVRRRPTRRDEQEVPDEDAARPTRRDEQEVPDEDAARPTRRDEQEVPDEDAARPARRDEQEVPDEDAARPARRDKQHFADQDLPEHAGRDGSSAGRQAARTAKARRPHESRLTATEAARAAVRQIAELNGKHAESITAVGRTEDGWTVGVEVVEDRRIPSSADILATYEATIDGDGELMSYRRVRTYSRGRGDYS